MQKKVVPKSSITVTYTGEQVIEILKQQISGDLDTDVLNVVLYDTVIKDVREDEWQNNYKLVEIKFKINE